VLLRQRHRAAQGGHGTVQSNGGMLIIKGNPKKFGEKPTLVSLRSPRISYEIARD
jgi:hypothetical protein